MKFPVSLPRRLPVIVTALAAGLVAGCASYFESKTGSGHAATSVRAVDAFSRIDLRGSPDLVVTIGSPASVVVNTDDNLQSVIKTTVANDTLVIRQTESYSSPYGCKVLVTVPSLAALSTCGTGDVRVTGLAAANFTVNLAGSNTIGLDGNVTDAQFCLKGSGTLNAPDLAITNLQLTVCGRASATVRVTGNLDVSLAGSGSVRYIGAPAQLTKKLTGSGSIEQQ